MLSHEVTPGTASALDTPAGECLCDDGGEATYREIAWLEWTCCPKLLSCFLCIPGLAVNEARSMLSGLLKFCSPSAYYVPCHVYSFVRSLGNSTLCV